MGECRLRALADRWRVEAEGWCTKLPGDVLRAVARELDEALDGLPERAEETEGDAVGRECSCSSLAQALRDLQRLAWANKVAKGFNTRDVPLEFGLLTAEVGEAFTAWRKGLPDAGEELADVALYLAGVAEMVGVDLGVEVERKLEKNAGRVYERGANGCLLRVTDGVQPAGTERR